MGTQQSLNNFLQRTMTRWWGQQEGESNNQIKVQDVRAEQADDDATTGGGRLCKASW